MSASALPGQVRALFASERAILAALFLGYVATGVAGLQLGYGHPATTLLWPSSGLALGALIILGYSVWPVISAAAIVVSVFVLGFTPAVLFVAVGHTLESVLAAYLVNRYANGRHALQNPGNSLRFAGVLVLATTAVGAPIISVGVALAGSALWTDYGAVYLAHALGSLLGMLLIAPPVVLFSQGAVRWKTSHIVEGTGAFVVVLITGLIGFFRFPIELRGFPVELLCMPVLLWPAFRLGRRASAVSLLLVAVVAVTGTLVGYGPFVRATPFASLTIVQLFLAVSAVVTLSLAALSSDYKVAEEQLREMVVTDPLTGLPNYRRLLEVLQFEIERADRQNRPFAVVFYDMDDLKRINDELGHLAGSRAVCRFAEMMRAALRDTDTAARYGGDEFVVVLSDTELDGAMLVVRRTVERLAADPDQPRLSVSAGIAVYPKDGHTPTTLLSAADRALYANKAQKAQARRRNLVDLQKWTSAS